MVYTVRVKFYDEAYDKTKVNNCFVVAESTLDTLYKMEKYYGENAIEEITIAIFSPDDFLEFEGDSTEETFLFSSICSTLGDKVVW